jgi:hypothetical protein
MTDSVTLTLLVIIAIDTTVITGIMLANNLFPPHE